MKKVKQERIFLNLMNEILSMIGDIFSFLSGYILGTRISKVELSSGIIVKIVSSKSGIIRNFSLLRNQRIFERMNWADTLYSVSFKAEEGLSNPGSGSDVWDEIRKFCDVEERTKLPSGWRFDSAEGRLCFWSDGEVFSIPVNEVAKIESILEKYRTKDNIDE